jgi:hypothetical protein
MKRTLFLGLLIVFLPALVFAQEKVEAPVWNMGDKWTFTGDGSIEVVSADQSGYILNFSEGICIYESQGFNTILFQKTSLNRISIVERDKRAKYTRGYRKLFDFPLIIGKQWNDAYSTKTFYGPSAGRYTIDYSENVSALGWEDVGVRAGEFKALKLEYKRKVTHSSSHFGGNIGEEIKSYYWYSPGAKYFVKCQYDKDWMKESKEIFDWELASFKLKK